MTMARVDPATITNNDLASCIAVLEAASTPGAFVVLQRLNPDLNPQLIDEVRMNLKLLFPMLDTEEAVAQVLS